MASKCQALSCRDVAIMIGEALTAIKRLNLHSLVNGTILGLTEAIDELSRTKEYPDPKIQFEIEELRQALEELKTLLTSRFVPGCRSIAKYVANDDQLERIRADLVAGRLDKLRTFLEVLKRRFKNCRERADKFQADYKELKGKVGVAIKKHGDEHNRLERDIESKKHLRRGLLAGSGMSATASALAVVAGGTAVVAPPLAFLVFSGGLLAAVGGTGAVSANSLVIHFKEEDLERMKTVTTRINGLNKEMGEVNGHFDEILGKLETAKDDLETVTGEIHNVDIADADSIMEALKELKENMAEMLQASQTIS